jgi:hypothetical protein
VNASALESYLSGLDPAAAPLVTALDATIRRAHPNFDVAVKTARLTDLPRETAPLAASESPYNCSALLKGHVRIGRLAPSAAIGGEET